MDNRKTPVVEITEFQMQIYQRSFTIHNLFLRYNSYYRLLVNDDITQLKAFYQFHFFCKSVTLPVFSNR